MRQVHNGTVAEESKIYFFFFFFFRVPTLHVQSLWNIISPNDVEHRLYHTFLVIYFSIFYSRESGATEYYLCLPWLLYTSHVQVCDAEVFPLQLIVHQPPTQSIASIVLPSLYQPLLAMVILKLKTGQSCSAIYTRRLLLCFLFTNQPWSPSVAFLFAFGGTHLILLYRTPRRSCPISAAVVSQVLMYLCFLAWLSLAHPKVTACPLYVPSFSPPSLRPISDVVGGH